MTATAIFGCGALSDRQYSCARVVFERETIDAQFYRRKIHEAYLERIGIGLAQQPKNNIYRLVHGEGDNLPGLIVDIYGSTAVMQVHSVGMHHVRNIIAEALVQEVDGLANVYYKSEGTLPYKAALEPEDGYLIGKNSEDIATENGLKLHIDWLKGQKRIFH